MSWYDIGSYNLFDWFIAGIVIISGVVSAIRGFVREALALTVGCCCLVGIPILSRNIGLPFAAHPNAISSISANGRQLVIVLILSALLRVMILYLIQAVGLSVLDHLLGSIFGLAWYGDPCCLQFYCIVSIWMKIHGGSAQC